MNTTSRKLTMFGAAVVCSALFAGAATAAPTPPSSSFAGSPQARRPQRAATRATSLEWMADVLERLQVLEGHATDAARMPRRFGFDEHLLGRLHPQLPAAGDGARP